jgi:hypothetical protein
MTNVLYLNYSLCTCHRRFCEDLCRSASFNLTMSKFSKSVGWFFSLRYDRNVAAAHLLAFMVLLAFNSVLRTAISSSVREENMAAAILFICFCRLMMTQWSEAPRGWDTNHGDVMQNKFGACTKSRDFKEGGYNYWKGHFVGNIFNRVGIIYIILLSNLSIFSVPDENYSRNASCALNLIPTFLL